MAQRKKARRSGARKEAATQRVGLHTLSVEVQGSHQQVSRCCARRGGEQIARLFRSAMSLVGSMSDVLMI